MVEPHPYAPPQEHSLTPHPRHSNSDESNPFLSSRARPQYLISLTLRTLDYVASGVRYIAISQGHHLHNASNEDVVVPKNLKAPQFQDIPLEQWMALTSTQAIQDTPGLDSPTLEESWKISLLLAGSSRTRFRFDMQVDILLAL